MDKDIENIIDDSILKGRSTNDIITILKARGLSDDNIQEIMAQYNDKSLSLVPNSNNNLFKKIIISLFLLIFVGGAVFYLINKNNQLSSSDQYGKIYFKTLPKDLKNFKKCAQEDILGKWEYRYSSGSGNTVARIIFKDDNTTLFSSISRVKGETLSYSDKDTVDMLEIGLKHTPSEKYKLNDGMIFTEVGNDNWVPIICLYAKESTSFNGVKVNKGEILNVVSNENKIILFDILSPVSI